MNLIVILNVSVRVTVAVDVRLSVIVNVRLKVNVYVSVIVYDVNFWELVRFAIYAIHIHLRLAPSGNEKMKHAFHNYIIRDAIQCLAIYLV